MLNLSPNRIDSKVDKESFESFGMLYDSNRTSMLSRLMIIVLALFIGFLFLPWTQNIRAKGYVTTLQPEQRPQTIHSIIAGRVEKWFVKEGDFVEKGDTILFISEIKDKYLDPELLARTQQQISAKELAVQSYSEKVNALDNQIEALNQTLRLKLKQAKNYQRQTELKVASDSIDFQVASKNYEIAQAQFTRMEQMYKDGIESLTKLESRRIKLQEAQGKFISAENKLLASKNALLNAQIELVSIQNQYQDKLAKANSDRFASLSSQYDASATVSKMQNEYMNYSVRQGMYFITAPQDGYVTKAITTGIGETIKEGEKIVSIMPAKYDLAVEMYIKPVDLPLMNKGQRVQILFDGWPAVVFAGWPNASLGMFRGEVVAIDNFASDNGKFRLLIAPDKSDKTWPIALRIGSGAEGIALLKDVPVWYEIWRQLNAFPPDFYNDKAGKEVKQKAPLKAVK
jgi:multidrug resistance efflux pump